MKNRLIAAVLTLATSSVWAHDGGHHFFAESSVFVAVQEWLVHMLGSDIHLFEWLFAFVFFVVISLVLKKAHKNVKAANESA